MSQCRTAWSDTSNMSIAKISSNDADNCSEKTYTTWETYSKGWLSALLWLTWWSVWAHWLQKANTPEGFLLAASWHHATKSAGTCCMSSCNNSTSMLWGSAESAVEILACQTLYLPYTLPWLLKLQLRWSLCKLSVGKTSPAGFQQEYLNFRNTADMQVLHVWSLDWIYADSCHLDHKESIWVDIRWVFVSWQHWRQACKHKKTKTLQQCLSSPSANILELGIVWS